MIDKDIRILIISNADLTISALKGALEQIGFRDVDESRDETTTLQRLKTNNYDLLITDLSIPDKLAEDFIRSIKQDLNFKNFPLLLIISENEKESLPKLLSECLIDSFIVQPYTTGALKRKIFESAFQNFCEKIRILIVDDVDLIRSSINYSLNQIGFKEIDEARDGDAAMVKLRISKFDLVITDMYMPKMTGLELLEAMREDPKLKDIPVIMLTSERGKENVLNLIKAGVNSYIVKPFTIEVLREKIIGLYSFFI